MFLSCQKSPTRHAYAWQIGPFLQDTLDILSFQFVYEELHLYRSSPCYTYDSTIKRYLYWLCLHQI